MKQPTEPVTADFPAESLRVFIRQLLHAVGTPDPHSRIIIDSLIVANLRGVDSHGIQMVATYLQQAQV